MSARRHAGLAEDPPQTSAAPPWVSQKVLVQGLAGLCGGVMLFFVLISAMEGRQEAVAAPGAEGPGQAAASGRAGRDQWPPAQWSGIARDMSPWLQQRPAHAELTKRWSLPSQPPLTNNLELGIPRILHHIYLPDLPAYLEATANQSKPNREEWGQSCALMHAPQGWWYVQWDQEAATRLITQHYAEYLKMWESVSSVVQRADMLKYFIMHAMGGLYLDLDIECWRPVDAWLEDGAEVVLQGTGAGVTNGVFAGVAGHPIWEAAIKIVHAAWKRNPHVKGNALAGPPRMNEAFLSQGAAQREGQEDPWAGPHQANSTGSRNSTMVVHAARTWYLLCQWNEPECHQRVSLQRAVGLASMVTSAGYHRYAASWLDGGNNAGIFTLDGLKTSVCRSCPP